VFLYAFELIELNGDDLRRDPLVVRKATLTSVLAKVVPGIRFNEHMEFDDGETVFRHAWSVIGSACWERKREGERVRA
jgi:bifunctional non-homologous end joining protein LigD